MRSPLLIIHVPGGDEAVHYLLHHATSLTATFCRRTSGNLSSDPREVTCPACQLVILRAWATKAWSAFRLGISERIA